MPQHVLEQVNRHRLPHEIGLRERGFVPVVGFDAPSPQLHKVLPACSVREIVMDRQPHGRIIWSHPGGSGLDPRALAPLSIIRVADGAGPDPLDEPITLADALRWLLTCDIDAWLTRPSHRVVLGPCAQQDGACLTHPVPDTQAQQVADALGDASHSHCRARSSRAPSWSLARTAPFRQTPLARSALDAVLRLGQWHTAGLRGRAAWELTLSDLRPQELVQWHKAGFTTADTVDWCGRAPLDKCILLRDNDVSPHLPLTLPPGPIAPAKDRGIHWYAQFQLARRGRSHELSECRFCGSKDQQDPCRTCRAEGRAARVDKEWSSYAGLATLHPAYRFSAMAGPVACGARNCRTDLARSAVDEGVRL